MDSCLAHVRHSNNRNQLKTNHRAAINILNCRNRIPTSRTSPQIRRTKIQVLGRIQSEQSSANNWSIAELHRTCACSTRRSIHPRSKRQTTRQDSISRADDKCNYCTCLLWHDKNNSRTNVRSLCRIRTSNQRAPGSVQHDPIPAIRRVFSLAVEQNSLSHWNCGSRLSIPADLSLRKIMSVHCSK